MGLLLVVRLTTAARLPVIRPDMLLARTKLPGGFARGDGVPGGALCRDHVLVVLMLRVGGLK